MGNSQETYDVEKYSGLQYGQIQYHNLWSCLNHILSEENVNISGNLNQVTVGGNSIVRIIFCCMWNVQLHDIQEMGMIQRDKLGDECSLSNVVYLEYIVVLICFNANMFLIPNIMLVNIWK